MKYNRHILLLFTAFLYFLLLTSATAKEFLVMIQEDKLTLKADGTAMERVLREIERQSNISMKFFLTPDDVVTANLNSIPLDTGLEMLMRNFNHSLIYKQTSPGMPQVISSLFIYSRSDSSSLNLSWNQPKKIANSTALPQNIPEYFTPPGTPHLHNITQGDNNPFRSMMAIDPLARFGDERPDYLPSPLEPVEGKVAL